MMTEKKKRTKLSSGWLKKFLLEFKPKNQHLRLSMKRLLS